jgi:DNA-binding HxlR family transcriptional regulator
MRLIDLCHHRWSLPILAELHVTRGARFVALVNRLAVSGETLRRTLASLVELGLVMPNPGHGHPLRPEYVLSPAGAQAGSSASVLLKALADLDAIDVGLKKWTLPTLSSLGDGSDQRFSELQRTLERVSPRALTLTLRDLDHAGLTERRIAPTYPPMSLYRLADRAQPIVVQLRLIGEASGS